MKVYIARTLGTIVNVWYSLDDAKEALGESYNLKLVHEGNPLDRYMSEWINELTEEITFLDTYEVIGFPTPESHCVGLADTAAGGTDA